MFGAFDGRTASPPLEPAHPGQGEPTSGSHPEQSTRAIKPRPVTQVAVTNPARIDASRNIRGTRPPLEVLPDARVVAQQRGGAVPEPHATYCGAEACACAGSLLTDGSGESQAVTGREREARSARISMNASTTAGSNWLPAQRCSSRIADRAVAARWYGRSSVIAE